MKTLPVHLWKEWREHRPVLLGIAIAVPLVSLAALVGLSSAVPGLVYAAPAFVAGSVALAALALSTELWAGEQARSTLAFLRRQPRGLPLAWAAKSVAYLLAVALAAAWGAVSFWAAVRVVAGADSAGLAWDALGKDPRTFLWPACVAVAGAWVLLVSTWIPRGAAAAGAAAILLGAIGFPAWWLWGEHGGFWRSMARSIPLGLLVAGAVPLLLTGWCALSGLRLSRGTWGAAWRGLAVVAVLASGGYVWAASAYDRWAHVDPWDPEARISSAWIGRGARFAFVNLQREDDTSTRRPLRVDLATGATVDIGTAGQDVYPPFPVMWQTAPAGSTGSRPSSSLVGIHPAGGWMDGTKVTVRWLDSETGVEVARRPAWPRSSDVVERFEADLRRDSAVRGPDGRRAWVANGKVRRETPDGGVEDVVLPGGARPLEVGCGPSWLAAGGDRGLEWAVDPFADEGSRLHPWRARNLSQTLDARRVLRASFAERKRQWWIVDADTGSETPAPGFTPDDAFTLRVTSEWALTWNRDRLVRVDWPSGARRPVGCVPSLPGETLSARPFGSTAAGRLVIALTDDTHRAFAYAVYDEATNRLDRVTLLHGLAAGYTFLAADGERGAWVLFHDLQIHRIEWGSPKYEVVFPR